MAVTARKRVTTDVEYGSTGYARIVPHLTVSQAARELGVKPYQVYDRIKRDHLTTWGTGAGNGIGREGTLVNVEDVRASLDKLNESRPARQLIIGERVNDAYLPQSITQDALVKALGREGAREVLEKVFAATIKPLSERSLITLIEICEGKDVSKSANSAVPAIRRYLATHPAIAHKVVQWAGATLANQGVVQDAT